MNHRERFFKALALEEPDYVPITDLGIDIPIVEKILGRSIVTGVFSQVGEAMAGSKK